MRNYALLTAQSQVNQDKTLTNARRLQLREICAGAGKAAIRVAKTPVSMQVVSGS